MSSERKSPLQLLVEERTGREIEALLRELYVDRRHNHADIAAAFEAKVSPATVTRGAVRDWCRQFGITREARRAVSL